LWIWLGGGSFKLAHGREMQEMRKHIIFFLAEDDLSYSIAAILDGLIGELNGGVKLSSQRYLGAILTELTIRLRPNLARRRDTLKVIVYSISELYKESYKPIFNIPIFPAVSLGGYDYFGEEAVDIASELYSMLSSRGHLSSEQVIKRLLHRCHGIGSHNRVEVEHLEDPRLGRKNSAVASICKLVFEELMGKLDRLRLEKKIDDVRYERLREIYIKLLGVKLLEIG